MTPPKSDLHPVVRRFVEDAGSTTQSLGIGRVLGQIYAYLYFNREPRNLSDMQSMLGISKGSASMGVRQLEQWGAVRKVWVKGDRKDYYEANDWFGRILRNIVLDTVGKKLTAYADMLDGIEADAALGDGDQAAFIADRIAHMRSFHKKAQAVWNSKLVKMLLK